MTYPTISEYIDALRLSGDNLDRLRHLKPVWRNGRPVMSSGNFAVVFKMTDGKRDYAIKCFIKEQEGRGEAYRKIAAALKRVRSECLIGVDYLERELYVGTRKEGENEFPVLLMDWVEGVPLDAYLRAASKEEKVAVAGRFEGMARWLLHQPIAHGDLKPDNILVRKDGTIVLLDYDGMYVPSMAGERPRETGTKPYCHPLRTAGTFDEHIDDHAAVLMTLLLRVIAGHPELDYDGLLKSAGKPELISQLQGHMADEGVAAALSAYLLVLSCGRIDASLLDMMLSFGDDMAAARRLAGDAPEETPNDVVPAEASNLINGHEYVDLGLSVKWATCNVGANKPEGYGDYYAWGETRTKSSYDEDNCETWEEDIDDIAGTSRDVARVKWGSPWRMPTSEEFDELLDNCDWEWTTLNGVSGYRVTGKNGNSIFLPAADLRGGSLLGHTGYGVYWSSMPHGSDTQNAGCLYFKSGSHDWNWGYRYGGFSVRPVSEF